MFDLNHKFELIGASLLALAKSIYLGVQIELLTRCKILDVASFLHCLQISFSLKSPSPTATLKRYMDLLSLNLNSKFIN